MTTKHPDHENAELQEQRAERRRRYYRGHFAERLAAAWLSLKGYRILGMRVRTAAGEIDLIAARGNRIAFVEVKQRKTPSEAESSITGRQRQRVRRAANLWLARNERYQTKTIGFDLMFLTPWHWPLHIENGL